MQGISWLWMLVGGTRLSNMEVGSMCIYMVRARAYYTASSNMGPSREYVHIHGVVHMFVVDRQFIQLFQ